MVSHRKDHGMWSFPFRHGWVPQELDGLLHGKSHSNGWFIMENHHWNGWVPPSHHPFLFAIFHEINHPALGIPPVWETSQILGNMSFGDVWSRDFGSVAVDPPKLWAPLEPGIAQSGAPTCGARGVTNHKSFQKSSWCPACIKMW